MKIFFLYGLFDFQACQNRLVADNDNACFLCEVTHTL